MRTATALGPARCQGCDRLVYYSLRRWRDPGQRKGRHVCGTGPCGALMPQARERCARATGHGYEHRSAYAMANARAARTGRAARRRPVGSSNTNGVMVSRGQG